MTRSLLRSWTTGFRIREIVPPQPTFVSSSSDHRHALACFAGAQIVTNLFWGFCHVLVVDYTPQNRILIIKAAVVVDSGLRLRAFGNADLVANLPQPR